VQPAPRTTSGAHAQVKGGVKVHVAVAVKDHVNVNVNVNVNVDLRCCL